MTLKEQVIEIINQADEATLKQFLQLFQSMQKPEPNNFTRFSGILKEQADVLREVEQDINENRATNLMAVDING